MQKRFHYNLERYDEDVDEDGNDIPVDMAVEEATHRTNIMVREWIEALTVEEVGQDHIFAPNHTFASFHGDEIEGEIRETAHLAWFYETRLFALEAEKVGPPDFQFYSDCEMLLDTSIITKFVGVSLSISIEREAVVSVCRQA